jgi:hypothetical protein
MVCDKAINTPPKNPEATRAAISHAKDDAKLHAKAATPNKEYKVSIMRLRPNRSMYVEAKNPDKPAENV